MQFTLNKELLLKPLQQVCNILDNRPPLVILSHVLLQLENDVLSMTGTDLEVELTTETSVTYAHQDGQCTLPGKKLLDICRSLPNDAEIMIKVTDSRALITSGRSKFNLTTLPSSDYPNLTNWEPNIEFQIPQATLRRLIESTQFSMAIQDARYFLNGMKFETEGNLLRTVATDGHRLSVCTIPLAQEFEPCSVILPRKGILDLKNLLTTSDQLATIQIGANNLLMDVNNITFTSKLIDGNFPDYRRVMPINPTHIIEADWEKLKQAFVRVAILSNERFRRVKLNISENLLKITAQNPEQEEAEEIIDISYQGADLEVGFNVKYILDVLDVLKCQRVRLRLADANSSCLIEDCDDSSAEYIIMPMRL